jgi:hypothetical protein
MIINGKIAQANRASKSNEMASTPDLAIFFR